MKRRKLQDRFSGPYCLDCSDALRNEDGARCKCPTARCLMPRCHRRPSEGGHTYRAVPVGMLMWRKKPNEPASEMVVSPGWACSPNCLFGFIRSLQDAKKPSDQALMAVSVLNSLQSAYFEVAPTAGGAYHIDERIWGIIALDQLDTIRTAVRYANMAAMA